MTTPDEKNAIVAHMLVSSFMERVGSLALLSPDIDGPMCGLLAAEILASLHRRVARDKGVSKEAVEKLRGTASTAAGNIYESSGMGDAVRNHTKRAGMAPTTPSAKPRRAPRPRPPRTPSPPPCAP